jgi:predicted O-methyltransferase YrrM
VEDNECRIRLAKQHLQHMTFFAVVGMVSFERGIDCSISTLNDGLKLGFLDGSKQPQETIELFARLMRYLNPQSLIVFDGIHWSWEM